MRSVPQERPRRGARRICRGFLLIPRTINGSRRWLEHGEWEQELWPLPDMVPLMHPMERVYWTDIRWMDQPEIPMPRNRPRPPPPPPLPATAEMIRAGEQAAAEETVRKILARVGFHPSHEPPMGFALLQARERLAFERGRESVIHEAAKKAGEELNSRMNTLAKLVKEPPADPSANQGASMLIEHEKGCTIGTSNICNCSAKQSIGDFPAAEREAAMRARGDAPPAEPPRISSINIDPSRIADLEKFHLPENHEFRAVYRSLTPAEAALSRAIKDQAFVLKQLIDMVPTGWDNQLSRFALQESVMRAIRAITQ